METFKPQPDLKLSEAILAGIPFVREDTTVFLEKWAVSGDICGCPLGTAYYAKTGEFLTYGGDFITIISEKFNVPRGLCLKISHLHFSNMLSRERCAEYAKVNGF